MGLNRLSQKCKECPFVDTCENKRMEALAYVEPLSMPAKADLAAPMRETMIQPHDFRDIKIGVNTTVTIDLEKLKKQLSEAIYKNNFKI